MAEQNTPGSGAELVRIGPTLIVGLGGTGGDVILRLRKRFFEKYGSLSEFPIVSYLWLDTDRSEKHILGKEIREFVRLSDTERQMVTVQDTTVITNNLKEPHYAHIDKWWYPGLSALGQMNEGAGQIRAYSRLAFFHHYKNIRGAISEANTRVRDTVAAERMMHSPTLKDLGLLAQVQFNQPTNVYIVCSIAGGTGSGMLIDAAFLVKDIFQEGNVTISAFLVFPDHFGPVTNERMRANSYALLKELNYYKHGVDFFEAEWERGTTSKVAIPPFDYCYVFDNQNAAGQSAGGQPGSQELIFELLADAIFKDFSHGEFADHKRSARVNLRQYMNATYDYEHPTFKQRFIRRYGSLGMSTIVVPHDRIITACSYHLATDILGLWSGKSGGSYNPADLPRFVKDDFLARLNLVEDDGKKRHDILFGLLDDSGLADPAKGKAAGLLRELTKWKQETRAAVERNEHRSKRKSLRDYLEEQTNEEEKRLWDEKIGPKPEQWGHYPRTMRANLDKLFERGSQGLRKAAFDLLDEKGHSIEYAQAVLRECAAVFKAYEATFAKKATEIQDAFRRRQGETSKLLVEVSRQQNRHNFDGRKGIILSYLSDRFLDGFLGDNRSPGTFRCQLQERAYTEGQELCRRLVEYIEGNERPDGRRAGGLVDQLGELARDLDKMKDELNKGYAYFAQKTTPPHSLVLYSSEDVEKRYYPAYVKGQETLRTVSGRILARLERTVSGLSADIAGGRTEEWTRALLAESRKVFEPIRNDFHVIKVLFAEMDEQTRGTHLKNMINRSAIWVTRSGLHGTFKLPAEQVHSMVGIPAPGPGMPPSEASEVENYTRKFKEYVTREISSDVRFYPIPDASEIIFYQEAAGFPINYLARLSDLRESYLKLYTEGECLHLECNDKKFPDLAILTKEERQALEEAHECFVLGCMFDVLEYKAGEYLWMERDGFQLRPHPLGDHYMLILKLAQAAGLREKLYEKIRAQQNKVLQSQDLDEMARYVALLAATKQQAWGEHWGKTGSEDDLPFERMMEVRVIKAQEQQVTDSPLVRKVGTEALGKRMEQLAQEDFGRVRDDGRLALVLETETA